MKKVLIGLLVGGLVLGVSSLALAQSIPLSPADGVFKECGSETDPIDLDLGVSDHLATVDKTDPIEMWCKGPHHIPFDTTIVVHPWIWTWQKYTNWDYEVYKPGWYMTNTCFWKIKANVRVRLQGSGFGHAVDPVSKNQVEIAMDTTHHFDSPPYSDIKWFDVTLFNLTSFSYCIEPIEGTSTIPNDYETYFVHGVKWHQRIHVGQEDVPGTYVATGTYTLTECI